MLNSRYTNEEDKGYEQNRFSAYTNLSGDECTRRQTKRLKVLRYIFGIVMILKKHILFLCFILITENVFSGEIAFTFDDAPTNNSSVMSGTERSEAIITALKQSKINDVLFFVTSKNINAEGRKRLDRYAKSGFHIANHTHSHRSANQMAPREFMLDVYQAHLVLKEYDNVLPYFRFPYLHYGSSEVAISFIQESLSELGYRNGYVTIDNFDWYINSALNKAKKSGKKIEYKKLEQLYVSVIWSGIKFYDDLAKKVLNRSPKHILLLHENDTSALFLPALVKHIRDNGWSIISPQEAYTDPIANKLPNTLFHKQGRIAALAHEAGVKVENLRHPSENEKYLDSLLEQSGVFK